MSMQPSMDDMMNMSFDELRSSIAPAGPTQTRALRMPTPEVPDHAQELDVYLAGPGADEACARARGVGALDAGRADAACRGKRDFILFENLDQALAPTAHWSRAPFDAMARAQAASAGQRVVVVTERGSRPPDGAQAYLATSLARWLNEQKTDGAGRCAPAARPRSPRPYIFCRAYMFLGDVAYSCHTAVHSACARCGAGHMAR